MESGYYEVYNQENVLLVDLNLTPIKRITNKGIQTSDKEYEFDLLIYATGFDGVTGPYDRIDIRTSTGRCLKDDWSDFPRTLFGMQTEGFPNMFMIWAPIHLEEIYQEISKKWWIGRQSLKFTWKTASREWSRGQSQQTSGLTKHPKVC